MKYRTGLVVAVVLGLAAGFPALAQTPGSAAMMSDRGISVSKLIGEKIFDDHGVAIGSVVDVVLKGQGAEPSVVLSVGDYLGSGKKMVAVPLSHVHLDTAKATMAATKQELTAMPAWMPIQGGGG